MKIANKRFMRGLWRIMIRTVNFLRSTSGAAAAACGAEAVEEATAGVEELAGGLLFSKTLVFFVTTRSSC